MNFKDFRTYLNKVVIFYVPQKAGYWNSLTKCCLSKKPEEIGDYYLDFSSKAYFPDEISEDGIPLYNYRGQKSIEHPIVIAQYALGLHSIMKKNGIVIEEIKNRFLKQAEWFVKNRVNILEGSGWVIKTLYPHYGLNAPWISAMAQGEIISVLTRAAIISKNNIYENVALEAIIPFQHDVNYGGLKNYFNGLTVYEEFPTIDRPMVVLNGLIFSLFGLYDLLLLNKNQTALKLFNDGIDSLIKLLPYFDLEHWSQYYLYDFPKKYYSSFTYHVLVVEQLKALYVITGIKEFSYYHLKWNKQANSFTNKHLALLKKIVSSNKFILRK